ncbi:hypothetical protein NL676_014762 [Syzygium grande]|nr:hypothetical protein NL676_014762 [Syzygium grande]
MKGGTHARSFRESPKTRTESKTRGNAGNLRRGSGVGIIPISEAPSEASNPNSDIGLEFRSFDRSLVCLCPSRRLKHMVDLFFIHLAKAYKSL